MTSPFSRRLAAITATGASILALVAVPLNGAGADSSTTLTLLNINDFHGRISPSIALGFAGTIQAERAAAPGDSLLLSAGDNVGASLYASSVQKDMPTIDYLNALGLAASAVGNHEFDKGLDDLLERIDPAASYTHLGANVLDKESGQPLLDPYFTYTTTEGTKVAVIGAVTTETPQLTDPSKLAQAEFSDPIEAVNKYAAQLSDGDESNGEAEVIIAEYHEGVDSSNSSQDAIINQTSAQVDVIFTGHTHEEYVVDAPLPGQPGKTRPVLQTGNYGDNLGKVVLNLDAQGQVTTYQASLVKRGSAPSAEQVAADPVLAKVSQIIGDANTYAQEQGSVVAGKVTAPITTGYDPAESAKGGFDMRDRESTMGSLVADMYLEAAQQTGRSQPDLALVNPGGLRDELPGGLRTSLDAASKRDVRVMDIVNVTPFANNLWTTELTGAQLKAVLEEQWQQNAEGQMATRPYLQLGLSSNVSYTYSGSANAEGYATRGQNIEQIYVNGKLVKDEDTYTVVLPSFLLGGGDNFRTLTQGKNAQDLAIVDSDAFIDYFKRHQLVSPNYTKQAVRVQGLQGSYSLDSDHLALTFSGLNKQSLWVREVDDLMVFLTQDNQIHATDIVPVENGQAKIDFNLSTFDLEAGDYQLEIVNASGSKQVHSILSLRMVEETTEPTPAPSDSTEPTPTPSETAEPTPSTSVQPAPSESALPTPVPSASNQPTEPTQPAEPSASPSESTQPPAESSASSSSSAAPATATSSASQQAQSSGSSSATAASVPGGSSQWSTSSQPGSALARTGAGLALPLGLGLAALSAGAVLLARSKQQK